MQQKFAALKTHIEHIVVGQAALIENLLIAVLTDGHLLLEGLPGLAKTTAVRALASGLALTFQRIQFTPDLIPGDITGTDIFLAHEGTFRFVQGPIFSEIILADEINRAPAKVQSALLEAMQERQVTVGGVTRKLPPIFLVIATQNPIEQEGTYPLPEAQLDRFLMKVHLSYPSIEEELEILRREQMQLTGEAWPVANDPLSPPEVLAARTLVNNIYLDAMLARYIVTLVNATRDPTPWLPELQPLIARGASPRATLALAHSAKARAFLRGRDFVEPADILATAPAVFSHRLAMSFIARAEGVTVQQVIEQITATVPIP